MIHSMATKKDQSKRQGMSPGRTEEGWHHVGGDIPPEMYARLKAEAKKNGVGYAVILRWALADYFAEPATEAQ